MDRMGICSNIFSRYYIGVWIGIISLILLPQLTMAQSEEDILNSIGSELESESSKKKEAARIDKEYKSLKSSADGAYQSKKYEKAKDYYKQMLKLKPDSEYAQGRLNLIDEKIAQAKEAEIEKKYQALIKQGDVLLASEKWTDATAKYNAALGIRANDSYAKSQIAKVDKLKAEKEAATKAAVTQKKYDEALASAERALTAKNWDVAKQKFNEAAKIKPDESYPREKAALIDKLKAEAIAKAKQLKLDKEYTAAITKADQLFATKKWQEAIAEYGNAKKIKPSESYPDTQIAKSKEREQIEIENKRKLEELETNYQKHKKDGETALAAKNWLVAIEAFKTASALKPESTEISSLLNQAKSGKKADDELALKQKAEAEEKVKIQKQYDNEMAKGAAAITAKNWEEGRRALNQAKKLKPEESAPEEQLSKLEGLVKEEARIAAEKEEAEKARLAEEKRLAEEAEAKRLAEEAAEKARQEEAARLAAEQKAAEEALKAEEARLAAEAAAEAEKIRQAKEADEKARLEKEAQKAAEEAAKEKARLEAEAAAAAAATAEAKAKEEAALKEAERIAEEKAAVEKERLVQEQKLAEEQEKERLKQERAQNQKGFDQAVSEYKSAIASANWDLALRAINSAQTFLPESPEVDKMQTELASLQAAEKKASDAKEAEVQKMLELNNKYQASIKKGDAALASKEFSEARKAYNLALSLKPDEDYPKNQLDVVQEMELNANAEALEEQKRIDVEYNSFMSQGEEAVNTKDWESAKSFFNKAMEVKPDKNGPSERLAAIKQLQLEESQLVEKAEALEKDYQARMKNGQKALDEQSFADAKRFFFGASKLKPDEELPKAKLKETEELWAEHSKLEREKAVAEKAAQLETNYNGFIMSGDKALENEMWDEAIKSYQGAISLKSEEAYPKQKLTEAKTGKSESLAKAEKQRKEKEALALKAEKERQRKEAEASALAEQEREFTTSVELGDQAMSEENYSSAVKNYSKAIFIEPNNKKINKKLTEAKLKFEETEAIRKAEQAERQRLANIELEKRKAIAKEQREAYLAELNKNSPEELAKKYPDGITEEVETEKETVITKSIIVENNEGRYLIRFDYPWGEHFYYLDGKKIREDAYNWNIRRFKF